jgi:N-acetylmuramoyl-L-alanine amidase
MRSILVIIVAALACACPSVTAALAEQSVTVVFDDGRPSESISVVQLDPESEMLYVRANDAARIFKATQFWNSTSRKIVLGIGGARFTFTVDTRVVVVSGEPVMLRTPVLYDAGFVMIPMEFLTDVAPEYTPNEVRWDSAKRTLLINKIGYNVTGLDFTTTADRSTATIDLSEPLLHHVDSNTPGLVRLKIYGGRIDTGKFDVREPHGLFNEVRSEQAENDVYVYFGVKKYVERVLVERDESPPRLRVIVEKGNLPEIPEPEFAGRRQVEIVDTQPAEQRRLEIKTVVLDPGHGGKDDGKVGVTGVLEKDVNLSIAKKIRDRLEQNFGLQVVLTREDDQLLSLTQRTEIANRADGDIFISVHCNGWFSGETGGFETYFLSPARNEADRAVARAENAADDIGGEQEDSAGDIQFILWDLVQTEFINESSQFAELIQRAMSDRLEIRNRGVKQANFTVLQGAGMPAVLVETAFLSNPEEEKLLVDESFLDKVAEGIAEAVQKFRELHSR